MGLNIYLQRIKPRTVEVYDQIHVAKLSSGWKAHFDGSSAENNEPNKPHVGSMDDLRAYLSTGEWELVDEYGERTTLDEVLEHDRFMKDGKLWNTQEPWIDGRFDREGYHWSRREFS